MQKVLLIVGRLFQQSLLMKHACLEKLHMVGTSSSDGIDALQQASTQYVSSATSTIVQNTVIAYTAVHPVDSVW